MFLNSIIWIVVGTGLISIVVSGAYLVVNFKSGKKVEEEGLEV